MSVTRYFCQDILSWDKTQGGGFSSRSSVFREHKLPIPGFELGFSIPFSVLKALCLACASIVNCSGYIRFCFQVGINDTILLLLFFFSIYFLYVSRLFSHAFWRVNYNVCPNRIRPAFLLLLILQSLISKMQILHDFTGNVLPRLSTTLRHALERKGE